MDVCNVPGSASREALHSDVHRCRHRCYLGQPNHSIGYGRQKGIRRISIDDNKCVVRKGGDGGEQPLVAAFSPSVIPYCDFIYLLIHRGGHTPRKAGDNFVVRYTIAIANAVEYVTLEVSDMGEAMWYTECHWKCEQT